MKKAGNPAGFPALLSAPLTQALILPSLQEENRDQETEREE